MKISNRIVLNANQSRTVKAGYFSNCIQKDTVSFSSKTKLKKVIIRK